MFSAQALAGVEGGLASLAASYAFTLHPSGTRLGVSISHLRYELVDPAFDTLVPKERFDRMREEFGSGFVAVELDSSPGNPDGFRKKAHSVLTEDLVDVEGNSSRDALNQVLDLFRSRLLEPAT